MGASRKSTNTDTKLTPAEEAFCGYVVAGADNSSAFARAFPQRKLTSGALAVSACRLASRVDVQARINSLHRDISQKLIYEHEEVLREAEMARVMAMQAKQYSAAVAAITLKAKVSGLLVEDRKNERDPFSEFSRNETEIALAAVQEAIAAAKREK